MALDVDRVREIAERVAASSGLEVVEVEFRAGGCWNGSAGGCDAPGLCQLQPRVWHHSRCRGRSAGRYVHAGSVLAGTGSKLDPAQGFRTLHGQPDEVEDQ